MYSTIFPCLAIVTWCMRAACAGILSTPQDGNSRRRQIVSGDSKAVFKPSSHLDVFQLLCFWLALLRGPEEKECAHLLCFRRLIKTTSRGRVITWQPRKRIDPCRASLPQTASLGFPLSFLVVAHFSAPPHSALQMNMKGAKISKITQFALSSA